MPNLRSTLAAVVTAGSFAAAAAAITVGGSLVTLAASNVSTEVQPVAVSRNLVCSGNVIGSVADSTTWTPIASSNTGLTGGHVAAQLTTDSEPDGAVVSYDGTPDAVAATESATVKNDLIAGYMATECGDPTNSQWLVGGSTTTGRDGVLTISNGSGVDARVDLEFWGTHGAISAPAASGLVIPAGAQKSYSLAGFAPNEESPVVHVTSNGAAVWSTLQVSTVRGLTPGGLDRITGAGEPSTALVVPIVRQPDEKVIGPLRADSDYSDTVTSVRLFTPSETDATATITVSPFDGGDPIDIEATVAAGTVVDIPIDELATGDFSVMVTSDQPVLAAVRFSSYSKTSGIADVAWAAAIHPTLGPAMSFVPLTDSTLSVANPGETEISVTVSSDGADESFTIAPHSAHTVVVSRGALRVESDSEFAATLLAQKDSGVAVVRLPTEPLGARSVTVIAH